MAAAAGSWYAAYLLSTGPQGDGKGVVVTIPRGTSVREIGDILAREGIIHEDIRFLLLAKFSGYGTRLQAGEFLLPTGKKPAEILRLLASARSIHYPVTIPEGLRATEIAEIFAAGGWCDAATFVDLVTDPEFIAELGFGSISSLEGYLFPDTYLLTRDIQGGRQLISLMIDRFAEVWTELSLGRDPLPNLRDTVILASVVEKETGAAAERPLIAGVFLNRLRKKMRLQSDPTVIYGIKDFSGNLSRKDLKTFSPYNTYVIKGLPKGPICNPGREAMLAVLEPETTNKLYFVSKNDGTHHFSATLTEHNRAVRKYQKKKTTRKGK
jgi:UPF0755 protein